MVERRKNGFTLIELTIVFAIMGMLFVIAFVGQAQIRARTQFDADINKLVSSIDDARNQATAGVNINGGGNGAVSSGCASSAPNGSLDQPVTVFAGTAWMSDTSLSDIRINYWKTDVVDDVGQAPTCVFGNQGVGIPWVGPTLGAPVNLLYVRDHTGELIICYAPTITDASVDQAYTGGACTGPGVVQLGTTTATTPLKLMVSDPQGRTAEIDVDGSGLARRIN